MKNRPDWQVEAIQENHNSKPILAPEAVFGRVRLDLSKLFVRYSREDHDQRVTRRLQSLSWAPRGVDVVLLVAEGQRPPWPGVVWVREECGHLGSITVECDDAATSGAWIQALRSAQW
ncbi:hypothetical protein [Tessaracoccus sp. Y1736]